MSPEDSHPDGASPHAPSRARPKPVSPRRRRMRWTLAALATLAGIGIVIGVVLSHRHQPRPYRPDEKVADITSSLARQLPPDAPKPQFSDVTQRAGLSDFGTFVGQRTSQLPEDMGPGAAWGDFDNDGWEDLFLVAPEILLLNSRA